jgi:hypothetical protein
MGALWFLWICLLITLNLNMGTNFSMCFMLELYLPPYRFESWLQIAFQFKTCWKNKRPLEFPQCLKIVVVYIWLQTAGFTMFVATIFPFFQALLGFFGGFAFAPTTYFVSVLSTCFWLNQISSPLFQSHDKNVFLIN